jgi:hypothetical protein
VFQYIDSGSKNGFFQILLNNTPIEKYCIGEKQDIQIYVYMC